MSVTTKPILIKLETQNYHPKATYHAKLHLDATTWVVCANTQFATVQILCLSFFCFLSHAHTSHQWTDFNDLHVIRRVSTLGCVFWCCIDTVPHFGGQIAQKKTILGAWIGIYQRNMQNIQTFTLHVQKLLNGFQPKILSDDKDPQVLLVDNSKMRPTYTRWRTAAILKNWKIAISPHPFDQFWRNLA